ncbi:MAG TPA: IclR family transcriptional regulator [Roseiflexaceae bacterium]|nr:IclR family transcriptional regulator [Roseiflexaceae bacterium]HMP42546.1 IclR family transcriptional regulator [Roseiflexaceae bacterium]
MIQSVQRAAALLKAFDSDTPELGVNDLSRRVGLHKSTASRLLATLEHAGLVERVPGTEKYRLGFELVRLAGYVRHYGDLRELARPVLADLAAQTSETVHLAVLDGDEVINLEQIEAPHMLREANWVGRRTPLHCVANGKALLAWLPDPQSAAIYAAPLAQYTDRTITDPHLLRRQMAQVRRCGYAVALGEIEIGLHAVAAAICDRDGLPLAAVSVSGPAYRVTPQRIDALGALVVAAATTIAGRML